MKIVAPILLLLLLSGPGRAEEQDLELVLKTARDAIHNQDLEAAIHRLESLPQGAAHWEVQFWLGTAYLLDGRLGHAAATLDEALALQAELAEIWVQRAVVEQERGRPEVALQLLEVAAQLDDRFALIFLNAGIAWQSMGEVERARGAYGRFLKLSAADSGSNRMRRLRRDVINQIATGGRGG